MIDLDILVSAKRTELTNIFPGYTYDQLRDMRNREMTRRKQREYRKREKDPFANSGNQWMDDARKGSERLLAAIRRVGLAA